MTCVYYPVHISFLKKHIKGRTYKELWILFKKEFRMNVTEKALRTVLKRHGIKNNGYGRNIPHPDLRKYLDKHFNYLKQIVPGTPYKIVLDKFNKKFGFSISLTALRALCKKHRSQNGFMGYFPKGHVPFNKGRKGYCSPGSEKGWFKKGHMPANTMPIGSERITKDGYVEIKISDKSGPPKNRWRGKHVLIWEKENGPVPKSHAVLFADGDRRNFKLSNLVLVKRAELAVLNHQGLLASKNADITKTVVGMVRLKVLIAERKRGTLKSHDKKKLVIIDNRGQRIIIAQTNAGRYIPVRQTGKGLIRLRAELKSRARLEDAREDLITYALKRGWHKE